MHRRRSLLLTFYAFVALLLTSGCAIWSVPVQHGHASFSDSQSVSIAVAVDGKNVMHPTHGWQLTSTDETSNSVYAVDDDCDTDDTLALPRFVHIVLDHGRSGAPVNTAASMRPVPGIPLLRPPRVA